MIQYYITEGNRIRQADELTEGMWVKMTAPSAEEAKFIGEKLNVDPEDLLAAADREEKTRIELYDDYTLMFIDIPSKEVRNEQEHYTTIPLGIILCTDHLITICSEDPRVLEGLTRNKYRDAYTYRKRNFVYHILLEVAMLYQEDLRSIDRQRRQIEEQIGNKVTREEDLIKLHNLESTLVYFDTSLRENGKVIGRIKRYHRLGPHPEDEELIGDAIVENQQAIEMTEIYRGIISGTRELMSAVLDNQLNNVMKILTSITLVLAVPTVISGLYGMNVDGRWMPLANTPYGFGIIVVIAALICIVLLAILKKRGML